MTDLPAIRQQARDYLGKNWFPDSEFISQAFSDHRLKGGKIRNFAETINTQGNDDLLEIAYLSHIYGFNENEAGNKNKENNEGIVKYLEKIQDKYGDKLERFQKLTGEQQAILEEKARLKMNRMFAIFSASGKFYTDSDTEKSFRIYIDKVKSLMNPEKLAELDFKLSVFANKDENLFSKKYEKDFLKCIKEFLTSPNKEGWKDIPEKGAEEVEKTRRRLEYLHNDVLELIEVDRKKHTSKTNKIEAPRLLREIMCDDAALIFNIGNAYLLRTGKEGDHFIIMGGSREEWGSAAMMAMKYLQDRGDPWRGLVKINGSPEAAVAIRAVFRQNSIRMKETGHTEAFLVSEIKMDVIGNYLFNHGRGYVVVRNIKCDKDGNVIYRHQLDGNGDPIIGEDGEPLKAEIPVPQGFKLKKGGLTKNPDDTDVVRNDKDEPEMVYKKLPIPETTETLVWDKNRVTETDTPAPRNFCKKFNVLAYKGIDFPAANAACVANPYARGNESGPYCLAGVYIPQDKESGRVLDENVYDSRLVSLRTNEEIDFDELCKAAKAYDEGQMMATFQKPREKMTKEEVMDYLKGRAQTDAGTMPAEITQELKESLAKQREPQEVQFKDGDNKEKAASKRGEELGRQGFKPPEPGQ